MFFGAGIFFSGIPAEGENFKKEVGFRKRENYSGLDFSICMQVSEGHESPTAI